MSLNLNVCHLAGNLTSDPETRELPGGGVTNFGIAVNRRWKNKAGEAQEETCFVDCTAWGRTAEFIAKYFAKGRGIYVEGRLQLDQWQDKEGGKRSKLKVVVESAQFTTAPESKDADVNPFA